MDIVQALNIADGRAKVVELAEWRSAARTLAAALRVQSPLEIPLSATYRGDPDPSFHLQNDDQEESITLPRSRLMAIVQALVESQQAFTFCRDEDGTWLTVSGPAYTAVTISLASPTSSAP